MRRTGLIVLLILSGLIFSVLPASAGAGWWNERVPIDSYGEKAFASMDFDWQGNFFTWDGGGFSNGIDFWKSQILKQYTNGQDARVSAGVKFRSEAFWGSFSLGYITGLFGNGIASDSAVEFYRKLNTGTGVVGEQYNIGERSLILSYQGISMGYTAETSDSRWRWGVRCNLLQGLSYDENVYTGLATFTSPTKADAYILQDYWHKQHPAKGTYNGGGYSFDFYGRYEPTSDWCISFAWQDLGQIAWPAAARYRQTISYETEVDVNGNIIPPVAFGNKSFTDHKISLNDFIQVGITKRYTGGDVTLGLEYRTNELSWGAGWRINLTDTGKLLFNYDNCSGGFGVGWENNALSILLQTSSLRWNEATTVGLGMTLKI